MKEENKKINSIDEYILSFDEDTRKKLTEMRKLIKKFAPDAIEKISYQMPTFYLHGNLVHFAAYKNHIGFYPAASGVAAFESELKEYNYSKGAIQFPIDKPLPEKLIEDIVKFRLKENLQKYEAKKK